MKWFYAISLVMVAALTASPFLLLEQEDLGRFEGRVVGYGIFGAKINSIDPATCGDTSSASIQGSFYEGLYTYHYLKRPLEVIPLLAESLPKVSEDGLTYTIRLRKGVKYSRNPCFGRNEDNTCRTRTVVADDFVLAFKRVADFHVSTKLSMAFIEDRIVGLQDYRRKTRQYNVGDFSRYDRDKEAFPGVAALDEHTLQIKLSRPFPQMLYVLAMNNYAPIPPELVHHHLSTRPDGKGGRESIPRKERSPEIRDREAIVGTGPYVMTEWIRGGKIVLERNPDFRDDFYPTEGAPGDAEAGLLADAGKKLPFVDVRYLRFVQEENPAWMLFLTKQRDTGGIPRDVFATVISPSRDLLATWASKGIRLLKNPYPAIYWLVFDMNDEVVGPSKSLRQAMCLAFNVEQYIDVIYNGRGKRAVNVIPSTFKGHAEAGPGPYARLDLTAAREKIKEAKEELVQAGVIEPDEDIPPITLDMPGRDEHARRVAEYIQGEFRRIGIEIKIELNDWPGLQEKVHKKLTQMYTMGWHADYPDAENFLQLFYSPNIDRGTNNANYRNPEFDLLYERAGNLPNVEDRVPLYAKMARIIANDCPVLPLSEPVSYVLLYDWVSDYKPHPIAYGLGKYTRLDVQARHAAGGVK